jgi:tRNA(adenine34) deaminase
MQVFTAAANTLGGKYLTNCRLYVTLEPCVMCAGAAYWTQIGHIVYGASDTKRGYTLQGHHLLHPKCQISGGLLSNECSRLLNEFFMHKRMREN